jgi:hypothetical protein
MAPASPAQRREARAGWPVRVHPLGEGPGDDLSGDTTPGQRLAMMWPLALEAWALTGRDLPAYGRHELPLSTRRNTARSGVGFEEAWSDRVTHEVDGLAVPFIGRAAFVKNKRATRRAKDLADLEALGEDPRG